MPRADLTLCLAVLCIAGCSDAGVAGPSAPTEHDDPVDGTESDAGAVDAGACPTLDAQLAGVAPALATCRVCHVASGLAAGTRFVLSSEDEDLQRIEAAFAALGSHVDDSPLLRMPSVEPGHPGGHPWPIDSTEYERMRALLRRIVAPEVCSGEVAPGGDESAWPLLGSSHGGSPLYDFCRDMDDRTELPPDPRSLVQPGVNDGLAVHFNAFWKDCHVDPERVGELPQARTCGELRARVARGGVLMAGNGREGSGVLFSGTTPMTLAAGFGAATLHAETFNRLWMSWGLWARPDNFDELVAARYGSGFGKERNPYPLPGEDPNRTGGGSGNLPVFFSQLRKDDGSWSGQIGITCHGCHSGEVGRASDGLGIQYGGGSSLHDYNLFLRDALPLGYLPSLAMIANLNRTRGTSNASDINLAFFFGEEVKLDQVVFELIGTGSTAGMDTPAWWNLGHRPVKFVDGIFATDAARVDLVFYTPFLGLFGAVGGPIADEAQDWMRAHGQEVNDWVSTLKSPPYPLAVDVPLAEQGAILFHAKDLWAADNPVARPAGGNGSCASCHGAYSPRFVHDPAFLTDPALEGVASHIVPLSIIDTDPVRLETNDEAVQIAGSRSFFGYFETAGTPEDCGMQNRATPREAGYLAPPLYGVWATAPYFHNGSVPTLEAVLDPAQRPRIWQRASMPARSDQVNQVVMGYDTRLSAFDARRVGWKYDTLACGDAGVTPWLDCQPGEPEADPLLEQVLELLYGNVIGAWNLLYPPLVSREQIEQRKIYNTNMFGQGMGGHAFTSVLTPSERRAIVEYLKTL